MRGLICDLGDQLSEGMERANVLSLPPVKRIRTIIVAGMGGSGIGGRILAALYGEMGVTPVFLWPNYGLPAFAGKDDLVFAVSYSGNTEETLAAADEAVKRGCPVIGITQGGALGSLLARTGHRVLQVPGGRPPRQAIGYLAAPLWILSSRLGAGPDLARATEATVKLLAARQAFLDEKALRLSDRLLHKLPFIYATSPLLEPAAYRWRCEFNENAKVLAHHAAFPELNHNEIVGWGGPKELVPFLFLVILSDPRAHPRNQRRVLLTRDAIQECHGGEVELEAEGESCLERIFSLVLLGDLTSYYLARKRGADPLPVTRIERLKARLAE